MEQIDLGPTPHVVVIECAGNLDIRGGERDDVRVMSGGTPCEVRPGEGVLEVRSMADCTIRMPRGGSVEARSVRGSLRIRDVDGAVTVGEVFGDCDIRSTGPVQAGTIMGEVSLRQIAGEVMLGAVNGSLSLRDIHGHVTAESINGELLGRNVSYGTTISRIRGNAAIRSSFEPGTVSTISADGAVAFRVTPGASLRFILPANVPVYPDRDLVITGEGDRRVIMIGDGQATFQIDRADSVRIKLRGDYELEGDAALAYAATGELSESLAELSAELEARAGIIEERTAMLSERIRSQIERRLNIARREVERAQRRIEREAERAARDPHHSTISFSFGGPASRRAEPVSEQERMAILKMLEEGRITVQEAENLLSALEGGE